MFNLIPAQYRIAALIGGIFFVCVLAFGAGWQANGWRLNSNHAEALAKKDELLHDYDLKLVKQNAAVTKLEFATWAANQRYEDAASRLKDIEKLNATRQVKAESIKPVDCRTMLEALKGLPK